MKAKIESAMGDPISLELLYRENNDKFKAAFNELYPSLQNNAIADCWNARLNYQSNQISWGGKNELWIVVLLSLLAGFVAKIPAIFGVDEFMFYSRHAGFIAFAFVIAYFIWKNRPSKKTIAGLVAVVLISLLYINLVPLKKNSDSFILVCIHLPLLLWSMLGVSFTGNEMRENSARVRFLRFNGDMAVMLNVLSLAFFAVSGITIGLFEAINMSIAEFYFEYIGVWMIAASPVVAAYVIQANPKLVNRISPIIAKIFSPLVLVTLVVYLATMFISVPDPLQFKNREFLIVFNMLLVGVLAIIFFSISASEKNRFSIWVLMGLSATTILVNLIAVAAIVYRIAEWGMTPNRATVLGSNLLILVNLILVTKEIFRIFRNKGSFERVEFSITRYLPLYVLWMAIVSFLFPLIFGFR